MRLAPKPLLHNYDAADPANGTTDQVANTQALLAFVRGMEDAIWAEYAGCGHLFDGVSSAGLQAPRYLTMVHPGGCTHARATMTWPWAGTSTASTSYTAFELTTATGGTSGVDIVKVPVPLPGNYKYVPTAAWPGTNFSFATVSTLQDDTPSAAKNRMLELDEGLESDTEQVSVSNCGGVSLFVSKRTTDFEAL
jgi:hypothetical protein